MVGAVAVGLLYQFYYVGEGGDTFGYFWGANRIWQYFLNNPVDAFRVIFWDGDFGGGIYRLVSRMPNYNDPQSFFVSRVAGLFGLLCFGNYTGIALLFAALSFSGSWALYTSLSKLYPGVQGWMALGILFVPSVVFWGSGILKDTITFSAFCWMIYAFINLLIFNKRRILSIIIFLIGFFFIFSIKKYILMIFIPSLMLWVYLLNIIKIKSRIIRYSIAPLILSILIYSSYQAVYQVFEDDPRYSIDKITKTIYVTAYDIRYWTGSEAGSGYDLGSVPETTQDLVRLIPAAVNVTIFRPYLWEASNPLMVVLALESTIFLILVVLLLFRGGITTIRSLSKDPFLLFALVFTIGFAYAVGVSTWNFGTLVRYKIPMMPIFASLLVGIYWHSRSLKSIKKVDLERR